MEPVTLSVKKGLKGVGAGNPLGEEKSFFEDMKQEDEKGGDGHLLGENVVFEEKKQEDEKRWSR